MLWGANATNGIINIITREADGENQAHITTQIGEEIQEGTATVSGGSNNLNWTATVQFTEYDESFVDFEPSIFSAKTEEGANDDYYRRYFQCPCRWQVQ